MEWLNYHHLLYFWTVVREGGLVPAARTLRLAHPTVSAQVKQLEQALGEPLFDRSGRRLVLTDVGRVTYRYADEIFGLGRELVDTIRNLPTGRPTRLVVGVTDAMPKLVVRRLLDPALRLPERVRLTVQEDRHDRLLSSLALHEIDVMLADSPMAPGGNIRAFNHLLGECRVVFCATNKLAKALRAGFPSSLGGAPFLMPSSSTALRRALDPWLDRHGIRPDIVAEVEDSALLKVLGQDGLGVFAVPEVIAPAVKAQHRVAVIGRADGLTERYYAISVERRIRNPAVVAITDGARLELFA